MTTEEIITAYESIWRDLALGNRPQFHGIGAGGARLVDWGLPWATCGWLAGGKEHEALQQEASRIFTEWSCVEPGCSWSSPTIANSLIHLNNSHRWSWLDFANKFRSAWAEGTARR